MKNDLVWCHAKKVCFNMLFSLLMEKNNIGKKQKGSNKFYENHGFKKSFARIQSKLVCFNLKCFDFELPKRILKMSMKIKNWRIFLGGKRKWKRREIKSLSFSHATLWSMLSYTLPG